MLEILKFTIPALIVLACTWIVMRQLFKNEEEKRMWELKKASQKEISPVRLRAYERLCLLLERTQPEHLLMDVDMNGLSVQDLQKHLLRTIRLEFDHNMSQQIYVSDDTWAKVMQARNEIAAFVNAMAIQLPKNSTAMDYAKILMTAYNTNGETPHEIALTALKEEARGML
ncbi:MAG: hypothetical protein MJZ53_00435 [Paludibacteraceae bacterium]|nr:hypothetical protein [Paludibacteraceae bacterium]